MTPLYLRGGTMGGGVLNGESPRATDTADLPARAAVAEADTAQPVAPEGVVALAEPESLYDRAVSREGESRWSEADRQAFLRRVQHVDPRERRA